MLGIFKKFLPPTRPEVDASMIFNIISESDVKWDKEVCIVGLRGFYNPGKNQRMIYDDVICIVDPHFTRVFNANTDPGAFRKGIANLRNGSWLYRLGIHGLSKPKLLQYEALVQASPVIVNRDQVGDDQGWFGINIHKGGYNTVSSLGCQTIHPSQWNEFIKTVKTSMNNRNQKTIKYILKEIKE